MVGSSAHNMEWQSNPITNPRPCSGNGRIPSGLGCSFRGSAYRGSVVGEGAYTTHQLLGVDGRCIGSENICKAQKEYPCTITNGQQNGNLLHKPYGGNPIPEYGAASLSAMAVVSPEGDNSFSRVFTRGKERDSRRRITNHAIFSQMDAECSSVQMHNAGDGSMPDRLVCNTSQSSVRPLRELAPRSICHGNRCLPDYLEELSGVRISTLCPSWQVSSKDSSGAQWS